MTNTRSLDTYKPPVDQHVENRKHDYVNKTGEEPMMR